MTRRLDRVAPLVAMVGLALLSVIVGGVVWSASMAGTFGFDSLAYHQAGERIIHGEQLYDLSVTETGGFGLFYYPPIFAVAFAPLALLPGDAVTWLWLAASVVMLLAAIWVLPVSPGVRALTLLLAAVDWPVPYALKLGQVGPLLLLLFAVGWRWRDRPVVLGAMGAVGAGIKVQPGLVVAWALLTRRWRALIVAAVIGIALALLAVVATGNVATWFDFLAVLRQVSNPITTPHNFTPGAIAFQGGISEGAAAIVQLANTILVAAIVVVSAVRHPASWSYLVTVVASQLVSPVLWDHYAMLLLLPVAALLDRGQWWTALVPLATSVFLLPVGLAPVLYPIAFWVTLLGLLAMGERDTRAGTSLAPTPILAR